MKMKVLLAIYVLLTVLIDTKAQNIVKATSIKRAKGCFDYNWQFHKGDIALKHAVKVGGQGGLTDINVKIITREDTIIDYTNVESAKILYSRDWKEVNLPHDWVVEGDFVHDNNMGSQPAANGYLPTGIGFYRKEFEIPEIDNGSKIAIEFDGIFRNSTVWVNGHYLENHKSGYTPSNYDLTDVLRYGNEGRNVFWLRSMPANTKVGGTKEGAFTGMCGLLKPTGFMWHSGIIPLERNDSCRTDYFCRNS